jgi:serpin B
MKRRANGAALIITILLVAGCGKRETDAERKQRLDVSAVVEGNTQFAFDLYAKLREGSTDNLFFSPCSISTALAMTYAGAREETEKEMARVLHFTVPQDRLSLIFASLMAGLQNDTKGVQFCVANHLWGQQGYDFLPEFLRITREDYGAELALLDFVRAPEEARTTINDWVEKQTERRIRDVVPPGVLNELTRLVLTNAVYFKGTWTTQFDKGFTRECPFRGLPTKTSSALMMYQTGFFKHGTTRDVQILEMPYLGDECSMLIVLPKSLNGLDNLETQFNAANFGKWLSVLRKREVRVYLPRFTITSDFRMKDVLVSMGMPAAFTKNVANFSGMDGTRRLFISAVFHKAFVNVNEEGTEAAAATVAVSEDLDMDSPSPVEFMADHPFVFLIRNSKTGAILFVGRVVNPKDNG